MHEDKMSKGLRSSSEPPEHLDLNQETGLRRGFPIKISGYSLGIQNINNNACFNRKIFGQRIGMRRKSEANVGTTNDPVNFRRKGQRESTPMREFNFGNIGSSEVISKSPSENICHRRRSIGGPLEIIQQQQVIEGNRNLKTFEQPSAGAKHAKDSTKGEKEELNENSLISSSNQKEAIASLSNSCTIKSMETPEPNSLIGLEKAAVETSNSLDDFINRMKNSLKAIKDGVNEKTLCDLNRDITPLDLPPLREMTPLDLPALSPLPPDLIRVKNGPKIKPSTNEDFDIFGARHFHLEKVGSDLKHVNCVKHADAEMRDINISKSEGESWIVDRNRSSLNKEQGKDRVTNVENNKETEEHLEILNLQNEKNYLDEAVNYGSESMHMFRRDDSSVCSVQTVKQNKKQNSGYESDTTIYPETDCEDESESQRMKSLNTPCSTEIESDGENCENKRISSHRQIQITVVNPKNSNRMKIDEGPKTPCQRRRRPSGRRKSMSTEKSAMKIRSQYIASESWDGDQSTHQDAWCPRCLETSHWEDNCWVEATRVLCPVCNVPGHLPDVHLTTDFRQRKLVIDTFGWLLFKNWFQDVEFRTWWSKSGFTGVPLHKIIQRNLSLDLEPSLEKGTFKT